MINILKKKSGNDLLSGSVLRALIVYSIPLIITNVVQLLFHATDVAVLGIMAGDKEVAAVGACGSLISMIICLVSGYSSAANVVISKRIGAKNEQESRRATGTALILGFLSGLFLMVIVLIFSKRFLIMTNCQPEILDLADLYLKIYFLGMPITML